MLEFLDDFSGEMVEESIGATVYSFWHYYFLRSLFHNVVPKRWESQKRILLVDNYAFVDFFQKLIKTDNLKHENICRGAHPEYKKT